MRTLTLCLAFAAASWLAIPAQAQWGDLKITFTLDGKAPEAKPFDVTKEPGCVKDKPTDETLVVGPSGGLKNVVVWLNSTASTQIHPSVKEAAAKEALIDNNKCRFEPRIVAVAVNQPLVVKNSDQWGHNSKIDPFESDPVNPLIPAGGQYKHKFPAAETAPVSITCSIHPWMKGYVVVRKDGYVGISDENGVVTIKNLPVGDLSLTAWSERYLEGTKVDGKDGGWKKGKFTAKIENGKTTELKVSVPVESILKKK